MMALVLKCVTPARSRQFRPLWRLAIRLARLYILEYLSP